MLGRWPTRDGSNRQRDRPIPGHFPRLSVCPTMPNTTAWAGLTGVFGSLRFWIRGLVLGVALASLGGCATDPVDDLPRDGRPSIPEDGYRVQKGDTLGSIAWRFQLDYHSIAAWNQIQPPYRIRVGQVLRLQPPVAGESATSMAAPRPVTAPKEQSKSPSPAAKPKKSTSLKQAKARVADESDEQRVASGGGRALESSARSDRDLAWSWPTQGPVTQGFRADDTSRRGIRIGGEMGQSVVASEAGKVVYCGAGLVGFGQLIIIKHGNSYLTAYGFNKKLLVKEGDDVAKGERIAEMGQASDGKAALHFEIRRHGESQDPVRLLPRR